MSKLFFFLNSVPDTITLAICACCKILTTSKAFFINNKLAVTKLSGQSVNVCELALEWTEYLSKVSPTMDQYQKNIILNT